MARWQLRKIRTAPLRRIVAQVVDVFARAAAHNFTVLRTWAFIDVGFPNGSQSVDGTKNGLWFQALDPAGSGAIVYNDTNLAQLDFVVATAASYGIRLIMTLTNNWRDFGGMDQYVRWEQLVDPTYTGANHDDFYVSPWQRAAYKAWVSRLLNRVNTLTGVAYKDDPAVLAWELGNEFRCQGSGDYGSTNNCTINYAVYQVEVRDDVGTV